MSKGSEVTKTLTVAGLLCVVCSVLVSITVVSLRPKQNKNMDLDFKKNILMSAGLLKPGQDIDEEFSKITPILVNMDSGEVVENKDLLKSYNQTKASKDPNLSIAIPAKKDVAALGMRAKLAKVYVTKNDSGKINTIIFNVRGKGLWSTMYGFIAVDSDTTTIKGFGYYSQGETPGLGGEVDNPSWKQQWVGKKIFDNDWDVQFHVAKGEAKGQHQVDGLSGATITTNGVTSSMKYWFGSHAYGKFLENVRSGEL